jgi:branched-chain amino acid transport system substrate-binding protein
VAALALAGCDDDEPRSDEPGGARTIYLSLPAQGLAADEATAVEAGARLALERAGGRAGGRALRIVRLDSSKAPDAPWDPGLVQANAQRASDDPAAIAYIGELGLGGSAVSVPVTNEAGLLQVSPMESLTSLTRTPPGPAGRGAPDRYYPSGTRTYLRLMPGDLGGAGLLAGRAAELGARRVALVAGQGIYAVELAGQLAQRLRRAGVTVDGGWDLTDDPERPRSIAAELAERRPDAVLYAGLGDRPAELLLAALARRLPDTPVLAGGAVLFRGPEPFAAAPASVETFAPVRPAAGYGAAGRRLLADVRRRDGAGAARPEALLGYEAARLVIDAVHAGGGGNRAAVARAALAPRTRSSPIGRYEVLPSGAVSGTPLVPYRLWEGLFEPASNPR